MFSLFLKLSSNLNINCLRFLGCNKISYVLDHFVKHVKSSPVHRGFFKCQFCAFNTPISATAKHLMVHSIGVYECVYCHYGINDIESMQHHMCNLHPTKLLYICVRLTGKNRVLVSIYSYDATILILIIFYSP